MSEGIKESKEATLAVIKITALALKHLKPGVSLASIASLIVDLVKDEEILAGLEGISKVGSEAKDLKLDEIMELVSVLIVKVPELVAASK